MLRHQQIRVRTWALGALGRVERRSCRFGQNKPFNRQSIGAAFSTAPSLSVSQRQPESYPSSRILALNTGFSCIQHPRTAVRRYSSQAAGESESTPFISENDADYLQRIVALGSSVSQVSDLAPLEAQLAMPNIPMTVKTIGAKVIIAALEQRQQWALLPALLSILEFRRLAESKKFGVGEQLFAALLRGQFAFASRRSGAAPDIFRTLDLAAKCNALHAPAVIHAVRAGYHALGLKSPIHITELLDVGQTDAASLQRLMQQNADDTVGRDGSSGPIGSAKGQLNGAMFVAQITQARKTQSVYAVLPAVLAALPRVHDRDPDGRQRVLGAVCGRDVDTIPVVQGLARALGTSPNAQVWSQVTTNAIHRSGLTEAAAIIQHVYANVPDGYVAYRVVHQVISALVGSDYLAVPSHDTIELAWKLFELHRIKGGDRAFRVGIVSQGTLMPLISAFMADISITGRETAVEALSAYVERKKLRGDQNYGDTSWAGTLAQIAALRCASHLDALEVALAEPSGPLKEGDLRGIFGFSVRFQYADATTAPVAALLKVLDFARAKGFPLEHYAWSYVRSIARALMYLHTNKGAGLLPVSSNGRTNLPVPEQHLFQALAAIRQVETLCHDQVPGFVLDEKLAAGLYLAYSVHRGAPKDSARLRSIVLSVTRAKINHHTGASLLVGASTYEEAQEVWNLLSLQGLSQDVGLRCRYADKLLNLGRLHAAIEFARRNIPDDPTETEVVRFVAWLLLSTEDKPFRSAAREVLPITANDARTREAVSNLMTHRRYLGLKRKTRVSNI